MSTSVGQQAEAAAVTFLVGRGYKLIDRNWRTRWCEIDIIAVKDGLIHFVEVKYRAHARQGGGLDYLTPAKLEQMRFAARFWVKQERWDGNYELSALALSGEDFAIDEFIEALT